MSLFVCNKCNTVENSNLVLPGGRKNNNNPDYPNLHFLGMQGFGSDPERRGVIEMLCSECNTGKHHGESEPRKADDNEMAIACFSKTNMITPGDHISGSIIPDKTQKCGYRLSPTAVAMFSQMGEYCKENGIPELDVTKHPLYDTWAKQGIKFNPKQVLMYNGDIAKDIEIQSKGGIIDYLKSKVRWRDNQSVEEREKKLRIAELKRNVKALKRTIHNSDDFNEDDVMCVHRMEAELVELKA